MHLTPVVVIALKSRHYSQLNQLFLLYCTFSNVIYMLYKCFAYIIFSSCFMDYIDLFCIHICQFWHLSMFCYLHCVYTVYMAITFTAAICL